MLTKLLALGFGKLRSDNKMYISEKNFLYLFIKAEKNWEVVKLVKTQKNCHHRLNHSFILKGLYTHFLFDEYSES